MAEQDLEPIDGRAWTDYIQRGRQHFDRVVRSRNVLVRNANELVGLLADAENDVFKTLALMEAAPAPDTAAEVRERLRAEAESFRDEFWPALDQRLHNLVASVTSLVDHTRPLVEFYSEEPDFQTEFRVLNAKVAEHPRSKFIRRLRNFLVHAGTAPLVSTMRLGGDASEPHLQIKLSAEGLLRWSGFHGEARSFIVEHPDGLPLRRIVGEYVTDMVELYEWLLAQYPRLHQPGRPPHHLREGRAPEIRYGS